MDGLAILLDKDCRGLHRPTRTRLSYQPASPPLHHLPSILRSARSNSQSDRGRRGRGPCPYPSASDRTNIRVFAPRRNALHFEKYRRGRYSSRCRGGQSDSKALARHCVACCRTCSSFFAVSQRLPSGCCESYQPTARDFHCLFLSRSHSSLHCILHRCWAIRSSSLPKCPVRSSQPVTGARAGILWDRIFGHRSTKSPWNCYRLGSRRDSDVTSIRLPLAWPASQRGKLSNPAHFGL